MGRRFGDILPSLSGRTHLGIEEGVVVDSFSSTPEPFGMIHMESGVFHHAGQSGVLRYNHQAPLVSCLEVSVNGGITFDCLVPSGEIRTMIDVFGGSGGGGEDLQETVELGDEVITPTSPNVTEQASVGYRGIILREQTPGIHPFNNDQVSTSWDIMASGFSLNGDHNSTAYNKMMSHGNLVKGSGSVGTQACSVTFGFPDGIPADTGVLGTNGFLYMQAFSGILIQNFVAGGISLVTQLGGTLAFQSVLGSETHNVGSQTHTVAGNVDYNLSGGDFTVDATSTTFNRGRILLTADEELRLSALSGSGQLRYQGGPYEAWHTSPSHTSNFFPIPHSGQVNQMILERCHSEAFGAARVWDVAHGLGSTNISIDTVDADSEPHPVLPDDVRIIDANNVQVQWRNNQAGTAIITRCD